MGNNLNRTTPGSPRHVELPCRFRRSVMQNKTTRTRTSICTVLFVWRFKKKKKKRRHILNNLPDTQQPERQILKRMRPLTVHIPQTFSTYINRTFILLPYRMFCLSLWWPLAASVMSYSKTVNVMETAALFRLQTTTRVQSGYTPPVLSSLLQTSNRFKEGRRCILSSE